ncbi:MAG: hypothetical protein ACI91J_000475, partial [Yoonia sp.]
RESLGFVRWFIHWSAVLKWTQSLNKVQATRFHGTVKKL